MESGLAGAAGRQGVHRSGLGPGHTLDIRDYTDIHSDSDISGMGRTFLLCVVCLNMERLLLILSMTKNQMLFGFQWNYVLAGLANYCFVLII